MNERELFLQALDITDPAERAGFLDRVCADNADLRRQLEELLHAHEQAGPFLDQPHRAAGAGDRTGAYASSSAPAETAGTVIAGKYKLLQQIGEGGMGSVWMADQLEPVKRRVAVKLIRTERDGSKSILSRFEAERQAIALMDHPNIAKLLDAGATDTNRPFFVMELVKGIPLTEFCDQHKLPVTGRLNLFQQICGAVQHAHQKGIIHRDLKPTNILVESHDDKPVPKVIDFGLAKAMSGQPLTEHTLFTGFGTVAGTPLYMAPEQAKFNAIDIDTRADIYALGVILYELLTGTTPIERETFKKAAFDEMLRVIREQEPPTPSKRLSSTESEPSVAAVRGTEPAKLGRFVKGELDWIVMKALSKERDRRYETANGFAKDIERFLNHEPVVAGPPSARYRLRKFVQRNRAQVIAASLVILTLIVGSVGTTAGLIRAEHYRHRAENARIKAEQAEADTLADYRANTDDAIEQLIGSKPELGPREKTYLENTLKRWQAFADRQGDDKRSQAIRAEGCFRVADLWRRLGRKNEAIADYQKSLNIREKLVEEFPAVPAHREYLALTHNNLGTLFLELGKLDESRREHDAAHNVLKKLAEEYPDVSQHREYLAATHHNLGNLFKALGKPEDAQAEFRLARDILKKLVGEFPAAQQYRHELASTHNNLGTLLAGLQKREEALVEHEAAREIRKSLANEFPVVLRYQRDLAQTRNNLGIVFFGLRKREEAKEEFQAARDIQKRMVEEFPAVPGYRIELGGSYCNYGDLICREGKPAESLPWFNLAIQSLKPVHDKDPLGVTAKQFLQNSYRARAQAYDELQRFADAVEDWRKVIELTDPENLAWANFQLGIDLFRVGKIAEAEVAFDRSLELREQAAKDAGASAKEPAWQVAICRKDRAEVYFNAKRPELAVEWFGRALQAFMAFEKQWPGPNVTRELCRIYQNRATVLDQLEKYVEAVEDWDRVFVLCPREDLPWVQFRQGADLFLLGKMAEAELAFDRGLELRQQAAKDAGMNAKEPAWFVALYFRDRALVYFNGNRPEQALEWFARASQAFTAFDKQWPSPEVKFQLRWVHQDRAIALCQLKKYAEAISDWDKVVELCPKEEQIQFRVNRMHSRILAGQAADALLEATELIKLEKLTPGEWYDFACIYALASNKIADKQQEYADRAMVLLSKALKAGWNNTAHLKKDSDLDPLRGREDFKKLVADLEKKAPSTNTKP